MYEELVRPMNDRERIILVERTRLKAPPTRGETLKGAAAWASGLVLCLFLGFSIVSIAPENGLFFAFGCIPGIGAAVCLFCLVNLIEDDSQERRHYRYFMTQELPRIRRALEDGQVKVLAVKSNAVVEIAELEDEGPTLVFDVGDHKLLFLQGQEYRSWAFED